MNSVLSPFSRPLYVMAKPASSICNLACDYCYYLEKQELYADTRKRTMSDELTERFIREYIEAQTMDEILFTWHGGEPLMRPIAYYKKVIALQREYGRGRHIENCIQTNGTLINEDWCRLFRENHWLVGLSVDGPKEFHDEYRRTRQGRPTFAKVMRAIEMLNRYGVEWNAMAVVNDFNADYPLEFYRFFKSIGCHYIQFTPIVERRVDGRLASALEDRTEEVTEMSVTAEQWGDFLCAVFDEWVRADVGEYFVQIFDSTLANWVGQQPGVCTLAETCGHAGVMEWNGDVYQCDHFVFPEYRLGNIRERSLTEMMYSEKQLRFGADKRDGLPGQCRECEYLFACNGECPKNRFIKTERGERGLNYLCRGYRKFFSHVAPYMDFMKGELLAGREAANVMRWGK